MKMLEDEHRPFSPFRFTPLPTLNIISNTVSTLVLNAPRVSASITLQTNTLEIRSDILNSDPSDFDGGPFKDMQLDKGVTCSMNLQE